MNAAIETVPVAATRDISATSKFTMLLKREFWENKGGLLWAPVVAGIISVVLMIAAIVTFEVKISPKFSEHPITTDEGVRIKMDGFELGKLVGHIDKDEMRDMGGIVDGFMYWASVWPFIVLGFVVFFYCLGSLYDERRDRSVLFWRSMPVSDSATVLSKLVTATLVAPTIATIVGILTICVHLMLLSGFILYHGGSPIDILFGAGNPLRVVGNLIGAIPIYAIWMLPTVGWLMLFSAWARRLPFLWATVIPIFGAILLLWLWGTETIATDGFLWTLENVVGRSLFSATPFSWMSEVNMAPLDLADGPGDVSAHFTLGTLYSAFASLKMWGGAAAGIAMIAIAVRMRRWRDEG